MLRVTKNLKDNLFSNDPIAKLAVKWQNEQTIFIFYRITVPVRIIETLEKPLTFTPVSLLSSN